MIICCVYSDLDEIDFFEMETQLFGGVLLTSNLDSVDNGDEEFQSSLTFDYNVPLPTLEQILIVLSEFSNSERPLSLSDGESMLNDLDEFDSL